MASSDSDGFARREEERSRRTRACSRSLVLRSVLIGEESEE